MTATEGQVLGGGSRAVTWANFVRLPHTLFAMPFAGLGVILASRVAPVTGRIAVLAALSFVCARFAAMGFNRIVDRHLDAANPRTSQRELPARRMTLVEARLLVTIASVLFIAASSAINALCGWLSPLALSWVFFYSYTKRFTSLSHLVLGLGMAIAPVGGWIAVTGAWSDPWWVLLLLALAVVGWGAGFDVIYSVQDIDFDLRTGLNSLPVKLGVGRALVVARIFHAMAFAALVVITTSLHASWLLRAGVALAGVALAAQHIVVARSGALRSDIKTVDLAFFRLNAALSMSLFLFALADRIFVP